MTRRHAFTLTEVLVTIAIIVVIIGILIPTVTGVRDRARAADTGSMIMGLSSAIERYAQDFRSYPGPLANNQIVGGTAGITLTTVAATGFVGGNVDTDEITGTENLVLGLLGGLRLNGLVFEYHPADVGNGAFSLSENNPKKFNAYVDNINLSWRDDAGNKTGNWIEGADIPDTIIPEFVDRWPEPMPILYMRANKGNVGGALDDNTAQYNVDHISAYTLPVSGASIGTNKKLDDSDRVNTTAGEHGLQIAGNVVAETMDRHNPGSRTFIYPYNGAIYIQNPGMPLPATAPESTPRQKDGFILISAGIDRVFGTADDITNFGAVAP